MKMNREKFQNLYDIYLDAEYGQLYIPDTGTTIDLPGKYAARYHAAMEIEDDEEREEALTGIEADAEADADVWDAMYEAFMSDKVVNAAGELVNYTTAVTYMDDEVREAVHGRLAPCTEQEFFDAYCEEHRKVYGEEFELNKENPVY